MEVGKRSEIQWDRRRNLRGLEKKRFVELHRKFEEERRAGRNKSSESVRSSGSVGRIVEMWQSKVEEESRKSEEEN